MSGRLKKKLTATICPECNGLGYQDYKNQDAVCFLCLGEGVINDSKQEQANAGSINRRSKRVPREES